MCGAPEATAVVEHLGEWVTDAIFSGRLVQVDDWRKSGISMYPICWTPDALSRFGTVYYTEVVTHQAPADVKFSSSQLSTDPFTSTKLSVSSLSFSVCRVDDAYFRAGHLVAPGSCIYSQ